MKPFPQRNALVSYSVHWGTPKAVYDALNEEFKFTMDACPLGDEMRAAQSVAESGSMGEEDEPTCTCMPGEWAARLDKALGVETPKED